MIISDMEIRLRADIARLQADMDAARRTVGSAMDNISAKVKSAMSMFAGLAAGLSVVALGSFIKSTIDTVDSLTDLSTRTAISVEDLAGLSYGAKLSGTELESAAAAVSKLGLNMGKESERYAKLGITAQEPLEAFKQYADIFKSIQDPQARAAFGAEALGKSWQEAAVLLNEGSSGITDLIARGQELSGITTQNSADSAAFNDALDELGAVAQGVSVKIAVDLLPVLKILTDEALNSSKAADAADSSFKPLTETFKAIVVFGGNVFYVLKTIGQEIGGITAQIVVASGAVANLLKLDFKAAARDFKIAFGEGGMGDKMKEDAEKARQDIDEWSERVISAGKEAKEALDAVEFPDPFGIDGKIAEENAARAAAFVKYAEQQAAAKKLADVAAAAAKKEHETYRGLLTTLAERIAAGKAELAAGRELTAAEKATIKLDSELASGKATLSLGHLAHVRALMAEADAMEKSAASAKKVRDAIQALTDEQNAAYVSLAAEVKSNEDAAENFGLTKEAIELVTIARLEDRLARRGELDMSEAYVAQLTREIELRKQNAAALGGIEALTAQKKIAEDNLAVQTKMCESIDQTAHDTFVSIFDSGKSTLDRLRDTLKNGLLDLLYQMTIKKWILNIGASVSGAGAAGLASAEGLGLSGGAAGGGLGGIASLAQSAKTAYTIATQGFSGVAAGIGGSIATLGNLFGSSAVSAFGTGMGLTGAQAAAASAAYGSAGMASTGSALTAGAATAPLVAAAAGIAAGVLGGKLISGQYGSNATVVGGTGAGAIAGGIMTLGSPLGIAIGSAIGGVIGGIANRAFGMGDKKVTETGITGTLSGTGFTGNEYSKWTQNGGWFRSDKAGTDQNAVTATASKAFVDTYAAIRQVSATLAGVIGVDTSALANRAQTLNINLTGLTTEADRLAAVTKFFEGVGNTIALELVPNLAQFQVQGEALSTTLQRVSQNYAGVDAALQLIGRTSQEAFGMVGASSIAARESLVKMAGGLDALTSGTQFFAENFLTIDQQMAPVIESVNKSLAALGLTNVSTTKQYADAVLKLTESGALATESGRQLYLQLLALAPAFKSVTDHNEKLNKSLEEVAAASVAAAKAAADGAIAAAKAAEEAAAAIASGLLSAVDAAFATLQTVVNREKTALAKANEIAAKAMQFRIDAETAAMAKHKSLADALKSSLDQMNVSGTMEDMGRASAQAQIAAALAIAKAGGPLPAADSLKDALSSVTKDASDKFATYDDYLVDFYRTQNDIAALGKLTDSSLSVEQRTLDLLQAQKDASQVAYEAEVARLDGILETARSQIDVLKGIDTTSLSILQAITGLASAMAAAQANSSVGALAGINNAYQAALGRAPEKAGMDYWGGLANSGASIGDIVSGIKNSPEAQAQALYKSVMGRAGDAAGIDYWTNVLAGGSSIDQVRAAMMGSAEYQSLKVPGFAIGGDHLGGYRIVGENGPELEATGPSRIFNASQTASMLRGGGGRDNAELMAELRAQRIENEKLHVMLESHLYAIAKYAQSTADSLEGAANGDMPLTTKKEKETA